MVLNSSAFKYLGPFSLENKAGNAVAALFRTYKNNICISYNDSILFLEEGFFQIILKNTYKVDVYRNHETKSHYDES